MSSLNHIADFAHHFLHDPETTGRTAWIWVDSRERGVDLAKRLHELKFGEFAGVEIPFDTLPTYAVGLGESKVFIISQPDHVDSVLVTMHRDASADFYARPAQPDEQLYWGRMLGDAAVLEEKAWLAQQMHAQEFKVTPPDVLMIDVEGEVNWQMFQSYIGRHTQILLSDRVNNKPALVSGADLAE